MDKNRKFKKWMIAAYGAVATVAIAALASVLGSNSQVSNNALPELDDDDDDDDENIFDVDGEYIEA